MLSSEHCPYEFSLGLEKDTIFPGKAPYPKLKVVDNDTSYVREVKWQILAVRATLPETGKVEDIQIMRLVAVLEDGTEMEMSRCAIPLDASKPAVSDPSKCLACGRPIPLGAGVQHDGGWYHRLTCISGGS